MKIGIFSSPLSIFFFRGNISKIYFNKYSNLFKIFLILVSISQIFISETSAQNFFPLKVGNVYQVEDDWWWLGPGGIGESGTDYYSLKVIKDTIINNELFYYIYGSYNYPPFNSGHLFRYDSLQQKLFILVPNDTTIRLAVDYNLQAGTNFVSYITGTADNYTSQGISSIAVLGDTHYVYTMKDEVIPRHSYQFGNDIGFIQYKYYYGYMGGASSYTHNVISAIIDSIIYNPLILKVDTLYPIQDRPVDTFPFLLTIGYNASYNELIDSFYISVEHIRADTVVQSKHYDIDWWNPHVTLSLSGLLAEDKVKLRATITDTSIYNNVDHYPNTGWVVINVLPPVLNVENENPTVDFELSQNYPNPFNPATRIRYQIPEAAFVALKVYDVLGNEIETLIYEEQIIGTYEIDFNGSGLTSGIYYYRIISGDYSQTKKMILLK